MKYNFSEICFLCLMKALLILSNKMDFTNNKTQKSFKQMCRNLNKIVINDIIENEEQILILLQFHYKIMFNTQDFEYLQYYFDDYLQIATQYKCQEVISQIVLQVILVLIHKCELSASQLQKTLNVAINTQILELKNSIILSLIKFFSDQQFFLFVLSNQDLIERAFAARFQVDIDQIEVFKRTLTIQSTSRYNKRILEIVRQLYINNSNYQLFSLFLLNYIGSTERKFLLDPGLTNIEEMESISLGEILQSDKPLVEKVMKHPMPYSNERFVYYQPIYFCFKQFLNFTEKGLFFIEEQADLCYQFSSLEQSYYKRLNRLQQYEELSMNMMKVQLKEPAEVESIVNSMRFNQLVNSKIEGFDYEFEKSIDQLFGVNVVETFGANHSLVQNENIYLRKIKGVDTYLLKQPFYWQKIAHNLNQFFQATLLIFCCDQISLINHKYQQLMTAAICRYFGENFKQVKQSSHFFMEFQGLYQDFQLQESVLLGVFGVNARMLKQVQRLLIRYATPLAVKLLQSQYSDQFLEIFLIQMLQHKEILRQPVILIGLFDMLINRQKLPSTSLHNGSQSNQNNQVRSQNQLSPQFKNASVVFSAKTDIKSQFLVNIFFFSLVTYCEQHEIVINLIHYLNDENIQFTKLDSLKEQKIKTRYNTIICMPERYQKFYNSIVDKIQQFCVSFVQNFNEDKAMFGHSNQMLITSIIRDFSFVNERANMPAMISKIIERFDPEVIVSKDQKISSLKFWLSQVEDFNDKFKCANPLWFGINPQYCKIVNPYTVRTRLLQVPEVKIKAWNQILQELQAQCEEQVSESPQTLFTSRTFVWDSQINSNPPQDFAKQTTLHLQDTGDFDFLSEEASNDLITQNNVAGNVSSCLEQLDLAPFKK